VLLSSSAYQGAPLNLPATIQVENFDNGGEGVAYHDTEAANLGEAYRTNGVDLQATTDTGGGANLGGRMRGWLGFRVNVPRVGITIWRCAWRRGGGWRRFHVEVDGANVSGAMSVQIRRLQSYVTLANPNCAAGGGNIW